MVPIPSAVANTPRFDPLSGSMAEYCQIVGFVFSGKTVINKRIVVHMWQTRSGCAETQRTDDNCTYGCRKKNAGMT
jgi:hypothetical protein